MKKILITGSEGLIGNALRRALLRSHFDVSGIDLKPPTPGAKGVQGDILDTALMAELIKDCDGIVHLAAVSRIAVAQKDPAHCQRVNTDATAQIVAAAEKSPRRPWIIYASSREVYGHVEAVPVSEDAPLRPVNAYGHSKAASEEILQNFMARGGQGAIVRFSNVYGDAVYDHRDRVVPAFLLAALAEEPLRVEGRGSSFDFTHLSDTTRGLTAMIARLESAPASLPPIHFVTGRETTLQQLAEQAVAIARSRAPIVEAPARHYDVSRFCGSSQRAKALLDWQPEVFLEQGLPQLASDLRAASPGRDT